MEGEDTRSRTAFFVSDGTGITAETLGRSMLAQFPGRIHRHVRVSFVDGRERARRCAEEVRQAYEADQARPVIFSTLVDPASRDALRETDALFIDLIEKVIEPLELEFGQGATRQIGRFHGVSDSTAYKHRIEAIQFTLSHDDGCSTRNLDQAEIILVGVSRTSKTPTSLYLAMQFGIKAANYPITPEDLERHRLPNDLIEHRARLFGLTITPERLHMIRSERRPNSTYAALDNCQREIDGALWLMRREGIPWLDASVKSIEEIAVMIIEAFRLNPRVM